MWKKIRSGRVFLEQIKSVKVVIVAFMSLLNGFLGSLATPVYILVLLNVTDYITGLIAAPFRCEKVNSYKGMKGIRKKVSMWLLVVVGYSLDIIVSYAGIDRPIKGLISSAVAIWLVANEIISILENISDTGVPVPQFLKKIAQVVKDKNT